MDKLILNHNSSPNFLLSFISEYSHDIFWRRLAIREQSATAALCETNDTVLNDLSDDPGFSMLLHFKCTYSFTVTYGIAVDGIA